MNDSTPKFGDNEKLSNALSEIFSNPQMLSTISSMAQSLKNKEITPQSEKEEKPHENTNVATSSEISQKLPELLNMLSSQGGSGIHQNHRSELLCALKPYLSQNRSDAIDKIIRFSELSSVFKNLS